MIKGLVGAQADRPVDRGERGFLFPGLVHLAERETAEDEIVFRLAREDAVKAGLGFLKPSLILQKKSVRQFTHAEFPDRPRR
jgi:hypothetical protein